MEFVAQLTAHSSGDYSVPQSLDDALTGVDAAVLGRIGGVERGRVELIDEHDPTIMAAHVNLEVHPDEVLFGQLPASEESLYVEFPWPNSTDLPNQAIPIDARVIVLAQHFGTEATELSATAVAAGESEPVPTHLALVSPWGFIVETDAEPAALPMSKADDIVTFARSIGVDVRSFDDMVDLLRQQR